jgi:hypothetical protein
MPLLTRRVRSIDKIYQREYLDQLINGYVDSVISQLDRRADIYFPVVTMTTTEKNRRYAEYIFLCATPIFPTQNYIRSKILALLECADVNTVVEIKNMMILIVW